jgi:hypothetical protein
VILASKRIKKRGRSPDIERTMLKRDGKPWLQWKALGDIEAKHLSFKV